MDSSIIRDCVELLPAISKLKAVSSETEATTRSSSQTPDNTQVTTVSVTTIPAAPRRRITQLVSALERSPTREMTN